MVEIVGNQPLIPLSLEHHQIASVKPHLHARVNGTGAQTFRGAETTSRRKSRHP